MGICTQTRMGRIEIEEIFKVEARSKESHKGDYGRALLVAGSQGMAGASVLAARAAMRSGVGLLTVHIPKCNNIILQCSVPEAMTHLDSSDTHFTNAPDCTRFNAVGVGPGLGRDAATAKALLSLIKSCQSPMVLDADALNIISEHPEWLHYVPSGSVITPHQGEFNRLAGECRDREEAISKARSIAQKYGICIVLKGAPTIVISPVGECHNNETGNPGMATAGSGDVLTGILLALLARITDSLFAARLAVYVHGLAGDIAAEFYGETAMTAGDIINSLPSAWKLLEKRE